MKQIVDIKNHKQILTSLFEKFKSEKSLLSIETILEIELDMTILLEDSEKISEEE